MKEKLFNVCALFGLQTRLQFTSNEPVMENGHPALIMELDNSGSIIANGGVVTFSNNLQRIGISHGAWSFALDVVSTQEVDGNYYFKCATDLCRVDLYICEQNIWKEKGEAIFYF